MIGYVRKPAVIKTMLLGMALTFMSGYALADKIVNQVIVSGQVTNYEYGNPVDGHPVHIESEITPDGRGYTKTVYTDNHGYYYDTISTTLSKGSFFVYTFDHYGEAIDTTVHFRFHERSNSMILADFRIYLPFQAEKIQARFKFIQKMHGDRHRYRFFDLTNNSNVISWLWNFGDGNISTIQNPIHEYSSFGLFRITLAVTAIIDGEQVVSEISKQIYITPIEYYHMGGHVFSEYFPIDLGYAYLYMIDSAQRYIPMDTVAFDTLGYYYFYQVPEGNYLVKAEPMYESEYYGTLMPTYYGNTLFWEKADEINLNNTSWEYNIKLAKGYDLSVGNGAISGNVRYVNSGRSMIDYSAKGVNIYLIDQDERYLTCHYSDNSGDFWFNQIGLETYWLYPEITGITAERIMVELTTEQPVVNDIEINILSSSISYIFGENGIENQIIGIPYPNPVSNEFTLPINNTTSKSISFEIYDSYGRLIEAGNIDHLIGDGINISTTNLNNGVYFIRTIVDSKNFDRKFIVSR